MMKPEKNTDNVVILMSTYNGGKFLSEQLRSIENQTFNNWRLIISDDGSIDNTLEIIKQYQEKWGANRLEFRQGPQRGFCKNFLSMACDPRVSADLYCFSDQDDVWMPDKLARAVSYFSANNDNQLPIAYGSRTQIVDEELTPLGFSPEFRLPTSFRNALVQSIAGGNTQVFNQATKNLFEQSGIQDVVSHDWWLYQLVLGAGGVFYFDPNPSLLYRQHSKSVIGANSSLRARIDSFFYLLNGRFKKWNDMNYSALYSIRHLLNSENREILSLFAKYRKARLGDRIRLMEVCGLYRQTLKGTFSLLLAIIINKV